jgi:hypothetical protein
MHTVELYVRQFADDPEPLEAEEWYPEAVRGLTPDELVVQSADLLRRATSVVTTSDLVVLLALHLHAKRAVRLELYCGTQQMRIDSDGELVDRWPGGFFRQRWPMLFGSEAEETITSANWHLIRTQ